MPCGSRSTDSQHLADVLQTGRSLLIVGAGFLGGEVAAAARARGLRVVLVEAQPLPLAGCSGRRWAGGWLDCTAAPASTCGSRSACVPCSRIPRPPGTPAGRPAPNCRSVGLPHLATSSWVTESDLDGDPAVVLYHQEEDLVGAVTIGRASRLAPRPAELADRIPADGRRSLTSLVPLARARRSTAHAQPHTDPPRPPLPPFTAQTVRQKVQAAEDAWNTRDPERVAAAYRPDGRWRNRGELSPAASRSLLSCATSGPPSWTTPCARACGPSPTTASRCASSTSGTRSSGNENRGFTSDGYMSRREASINDVRINEVDRRIRGLRRAGTSDDLPLH